MPRIQTILSNELEQALREKSKRTGVPLSALLRRAIERELDADGVVIHEKVQWGGKRAHDGQSIEPLEHGGKREKQAV